MMSPEQVNKYAKEFDLTTKEGCMVFSDFLQDMGEMKWANLFIWINTTWDGNYWMDSVIRWLGWHKTDTMLIIFERWYIAAQLRKLPIIPFNEEPT